jgi:hypothetical protein
MSASQAYGVTSNAHPSLKSSALASILKGYGRAERNCGYQATILHVLASHSSGVGGLGVELGVGLGVDLGGAVLLVRGLA